MAEVSDRKRGRDSSEEVDFPEVKKLREDLLENIEDDDICSTSADLDSFMKSFEDEISSSLLTEEDPQPLLIEYALGRSRDEISYSNIPDLGYLLEASDDELGLPPTMTSPSKLGEEEVAELVRISPDSSGGSSELGEMWGFDEFDFGVDLTEDINGVGNEFVAIDGLFDYSDMGFGEADFICRPETLPAQ